MVTILEKSEHNIDFHPIVDFVEASPLRYALTVKPTVYVSHIQQFWSTARIKTMKKGTKILATVDGILRTVTESFLRRNLKLKDEEGISIPTEPHHIPSPKAQPISSTTPSLPKLTSVTTTLIPTVTPSDTPTLRQYTRRARIAQSLALPPVADEPASPLRDVSQGKACPTDSGFGADQDRANIAYKGNTQRWFLNFGAQELEINMLNARVKLLEEREGGGAERFRDDAPIKGRNLDEEEAAAEIVSDDIEEMTTVLTSMDAATVLASGVAEVSTGSGSIPTTGPPTAEVPIGSDVVPTVGPIFATATVVTPYIRRKGKETMVESKTPKKKKEYHQFATELPLERRIELISDLIRYQDNYAKVYKFQTQQRKPWSKKQKRDYYMAVIKSNLGWKVKDFRGMTFKEIKAKFTTVWKQIGNFIPMGLKEEAERFKRKGIRFEKESVKKLKTSEEVPEEVKTPDEVPKEKVKEMMQLVPIEEVYVEALQVKHPIIDWKVHIEGQRSYWKITRLGGSSASYQFFVDMLKHLDREDLNQLWALVKESLSIRTPTTDKEMELWVGLKRIYKPDDEDQLWTHTQNLMHAPVEWKLYDMCRVHQGRIVGNKMHKAFPLPVMEFPLPEEVPTANEESSHCQKKRDATVVKIALLLKLRRNYQSKSNDSYTKVCELLGDCAFWSTIVDEGNPVDAASTGATTSAIGVMNLRVGRSTLGEGFGMSPGLIVA
nr:hypothetical protein [Tanacetum cinerariifolium]